MPGASDQTRRVKIVNANWIVGPDRDDGRFEFQRITDDDERHTIVPSPVAAAALIALIQGDTVLAWAVGGAERRLAGDRD
jgi:hypothetical protein